MGFSLENRLNVVAYLAIAWVMSTSTSFAVDTDICTPSDVLVNKISGPASSQFPARPNATIAGRFPGTSSAARCCISRDKPTSQNLPKLTFDESLYAQSQRA